MRICIIGKFPPIQGGVSMRTYWSAHGLARLGHEVHVFTNANEVRAPFRMHMRDEDWRRCEASYEAGSVTVHWTASPDAAQNYIPMASPFVSKLAGIVLKAHAQHAFDVIFSHYLEPYGVAGHLAAQALAVPHVVRMAGSDAGRLWRHPQLGSLYDLILRSANVCVASGPIAQRAVERGVSADRVANIGLFAVPEELFCDEGEVLDIPALRTEILQQGDAQLRPMLWGGFAGTRPHIGVYGKLGRSKGSIALLEALQRLVWSGVDIGLVALAQGGAEEQRLFRARAEQLGLADHVLQLPFLPHWRVSAFLRGCLAVCCLEQDFQIAAHCPIIPREVLLTGICLIGSTEVIRKLPAYHQLPDGYGCIAIEDVNDIATLSERLEIISRRPQAAALVGARGRSFARRMQRGISFVGRLERILESAAEKRALPLELRSLPNARQAETGRTRFPLSHTVAAVLDLPIEDFLSSSAPVDLEAAERLLQRLEKQIANGQTTLRPMQTAVQIDVAVTKAASQCDDASERLPSDPLFRHDETQWCIVPEDITNLIPIRAAATRIVEFDFDVAGFLKARTAMEYSVAPAATPSHMIVFGSARHTSEPPLLIDKLTAKLLELSQGSKTVGEIIREIGQQEHIANAKQLLAWIERMFASGLIGFRKEKVGSSEGVFCDAHGAAVVATVARQSTAH